MAASGSTAVVGTDKTFTLGTEVTLSPLVLIGKVHLSGVMAFKSILLLFLESEE